MLSGFTIAVSPLGVLSLCIISLTALCIICIIICMDSKRELSDYELELRKCCEERDVLDRRIKGLVKVIEGLSLLSNRHALPASHGKIPSLVVGEVGVTDAVRNYLEHVAVAPAFPVEIRDALIAAGYYGNGPQSVLLAVHSVLSRMEKRGEIDPVQRDGKTAYVRISLITRAIREAEKQKKERLIKIWSNQ
jgi:hypothetical protein